jgi:hypothetical protein
MFQPIFEKYGKGRDDALFLVIDSDDVESVFPDGEITSFPTFKRLIDGVIGPEELAVDRSSEEAAFRSLDQLLPRSGMDSSPNGTYLEAKILQLQNQVHDLTLQMEELVGYLQDKPATRRRTKKEAGSSKKATPKRKTKKASISRSPLRRSQYA